MRKIVVLLSVIFIFLAPSVSAAITNQDDIGKSSAISCFDYFRPNSVLIHLSIFNRDLKPGDELRGVATLKNETGHPIANGNAFLQIWRKDKIIESNVLLEEFFVDGLVALNDKQEVSIPFSWKVPTGISSGDYIVAGHFVINKKTLFPIIIPISRRNHSQKCQQMAFTIILKIYRDIYLK